MPEPLTDGTTTEPIARRLAGKHGGLVRAALIGSLAGAAYGIAARGLLNGGAAGMLSMLTLSFLVLVPGVIGYLAVYPAARPGWLYRIFVPWLPAVATILTTIVAGWEGAICVFMSTPLILLLASVGGVIAGAHAQRRLRHAALAIALPVLLAPIEALVPVPVRTQRNVTEIVVEAPASVVWREVASVPPIRPDEHRDALYLRLGFPRPVSAELTRPGVGGIRHARFEGNVLFVETITAWDEESRIAFTIDAQTDSIPPTTLDPHVTIGGEYFDVLSGEYELIPLADGRTRVVLTSEHRLSTTINPYAGFWAGLVMRSIQNNILHVVRDRAEAAAAVQ